ncbi:MAG: DUF4160 domain-containing protein [Leptospiraceae bacterium]|nr:DUF4160 domain-containing protein [Leptospiraceae bacterium]
MPTVLRAGPFRFHFYSNEGTEPAHIHVENPDGECKFWLNPVQLAHNRGVKAVDLRRIERLVFFYYQLLLDSYNEFHGHI